MDLCKTRHAQFDCNSRYEESLRRNNIKWNLAISVDSKDSGLGDPLSWDGRKTADFVKVSNDGLWEWDGSDWLPRDTTKKQTTQNNQEQESGVQPDLVQIPNIYEPSEEAVDLVPSTKIGTISPEGYHEWDGEKWLPVELGKVSEDGCWIWNGEKWVGNQGVQTHVGADKQKLHSEAISPVPNPLFHNQEMIIIQQNKNTSRVFAKLSLVIVVPVVLVAITVVLAGLLYVWADSLSEEQDQTKLTGTWYNYEDTLTLYPNGTVVESTGGIVKWNSEGYNLTLTYLIDDEETDIIWRYEIKIDSDDDRILFLAYYAFEDGIQTNEIAENSCICYGDSIKGADREYWEDKTAIIPDWCEFVESE